ncbi:MAG: DNA-directed DNA polymerase II small subunit [Candidatus Thorarchaeota archaeon]
MARDSLRQAIVKRLLSAGCQISPDALSSIIDLEAPMKFLDCIVDLAIASGKSVITGEIIDRMRKSDEDILRSHSLTTSDVNEDHDLKAAAHRAEEPITIISTPTDDSVGSAGELEDFMELFRDRFRRLSRIYRSRVDTMSAVLPTAVESSERNLRTPMVAGTYSRRPVQVVLGMVREKTVSRSGNIILVLEDEESTMTCIVPSNRADQTGRTLMQKGTSLLLDEVVCVVGRTDDGGRFIADDILFPDIPTSRKKGRSKRSVYAAFVSDLHFGSDKFLEDDFDRFLHWMCGKDVDSSDKEIVRNTEYLFIAGDLCDGVGVYPDQERDLAILNLEDQYRQLADKIRSLPERIKVICIPGNHDASRQALPRPPVLRMFANPLYELGGRIVMLGDPSYVLVEGVTVLLTHGDVLDDLVIQIPGVTYRSPENGMRELLKKRHLSPIYGGKTELAPISRDWMVIERVPDIVHFGHAHHNAVDTYRGVLMVNSGTFQAQTEFMKKQGVEPTPGIVTFVDLHTCEPVLRFFHEYH